VIPLRDQIEEAVRAGQAESAETLLGRLFRDQPTAANAAFVNARFDELRPALTLTPIRLAILRSFTIEPLVPLLRAHAFVAGIDVTLHIGDFNVVEQALLEPADRLYEFQPDVTAIAVLTRDLVPSLWNGEVDARDVDGAVARVQGWIGAYRTCSAAPVVIHSFEEPALPSAGVLDAQDGDGQRAAIRRLNETIADVSSSLYFLLAT